MTVQAQVEAEVRRLYYAEHWKPGTMADQLEVHGDVVRRVLGLLERSGPSPQQRPRSETLARYPRLRATRLYDMTGCSRGARGLQQEHEIDAQHAP